MAITVHLDEVLKARGMTSKELCATVGITEANLSILRSGKARKNDPPIPADLAPISGSGKRARREQTEEKPVLEPIRFRYSTETIVDDPVDEKPEAAEIPEPKAPRSRNRRRKPRPAGDGQ